LGDDAQVAQFCGGRGAQQAADTGSVPLQAEKIALRFGLRAPGEVLAVAEADFQRAGSATAEQCRQVEPARAEVHAEARPLLGERALLRAGQASGTGDERADGAQPRIRTRPGRAHAGSLNEGSGTGSRRSARPAAAQPWARSSADSPHGGTWDHR